MNIILTSGKVHSAVVLDDYAPFPLCGGNKSVGRYSETETEVDCKRCIQRLARKAEAAERTAYYAGLADAQDMDLSQAAAQDEDERVA